MTRQRSCFLLGYNGKQNTGSDARLVAIVDQLYECFGPQLEVSAATMDVHSTAKLLGGSRPVHLVQIYPAFLPTIAWHVARHDMTFLIEGSTFKQNWSKVLLYVYLVAALISKCCGKKCVAYAVDVGTLSPLNRYLVRFVCNRIDLIITRTDAARQRLLDLGVESNVMVNTDPAFRFLQEHSDSCTASRQDRRPNPTVGIAPIEFYQWPVRMRFLGRKSECYQWPYYFTWDRKRRRKSVQTINTFVALVRHCIDAHDLNVVLIAMEQLDEEVCEKIRESLEPAHRTRVDVVSSRNMPPDEMVPLLRGLEYLVTSRYHACVLSMATAVPQMAVHHDERLESIYQELNLHEELLLHHEECLSPTPLLATFDRLVMNRRQVESLLRMKHDNYFFPRCDRIVADLRLAADSWSATTSPRSTNERIASGTQGVSSR